MFGNRAKTLQACGSFLPFFLRFVEENAGKKAVDWVAMADTAAVTAWSGIAFENVCFNHIKQIKACLGISGVSTSESLWSKRGDEDSEGTQIDLIIERKDHVINMCEIKFVGDEFTVTRDYHLLLERRKRLLYEKIPNKAAIHCTLITSFGLRRAEHFSDIISTIPLEDLFRE